MIGKLIQRIRNDKGITQKRLSQITELDQGHIRHLENNKRHPSQKSLSIISKALDVPYFPLQCMLNTELTEDQKRYNAINHVVYDKLPIFDDIPRFISYPKEMYSSMFAFKITSDDMCPKFNVGDYAFVELNSPLDHKDFGLFNINGDTVIRQFIMHKHDIVLRANKENIPDIKLSYDDNFEILGKIIGTKHID